VAGVLSIASSKLDRVIKLTDFRPDRGPRFSDNHRQLPTQPNGATQRRVARPRALVGLRQRFRSTAMTEAGLAAALSGRGMRAASPGKVGRLFADIVPEHVDKEPKNKKKKKSKPETL